MREIAVCSMLLFPLCCGVIGYDILVFVVLEKVIGEIYSFRFCIADYFVQLVDVLSLSEKELNEAVNCWGLDIHSFEFGENNIFDGI